MEALHIFNEGELGSQDPLNKNFRILQEAIQEAIGKLKLISKKVVEMVTHLDANTAIDYNPDNLDVRLIELIFSGYATTARDYNHTSLFITPPKISEIGEWSMRKAWFGNVEKTFYVSNTQIRGHESNAAGGPSDAIVLRRVVIHYNG